MAVKIHTPTEFAMHGLALPPSLNNAYMTVRGRRVLTREARDYKASVAAQVALQAAVCAFVVPPRTPLVFTVRFWFQRNNRDGDNAVKLLQDAISEALGFNDRWIKEWHIYTDKDAACPRCAFILTHQEPTR